MPRTALAARPKRPTVIMPPQLVQFKDAEQVALVPWNTANILRTFEHTDDPAQAQIISMEWLRRPEERQKTNRLPG